MPHSYPISQSRIFVTITASTNVEIFDINQTLKEIDKKADNKTYQIFDADKIAGPLHLYYAAANAYYAIEKGTNISKRLDIETILYASAQTQISKAIETIGVNKKTHHVAVLLFSENKNDHTAVIIAESLGKLDDSALNITRQKYQALIKLFNISISAIESIGGDKNKALISLITEKGALISLKR
jgi:tRNA threonylcarbamoyladenosine modification (KEOPS) complex Cgi121 subunit